MIFHQTFNSNANYSFNIAIYSDTVWENHFHKNLELIYILKGNLTCTLNSTTYKMTAGDFGLCLPYDIHSYVPQKGCEYWILVFSGDFVHSFSKEIVGKIGNGCVFRAKKTIERYVKEQLINNPQIMPLRYLRRVFSGRPLDAEGRKKGGNNRSHRRLRFREAYGTHLAPGCGNCVRIRLQLYVTPFQKCF